MKPKRARRGRPPGRERLDPGVTLIKKYGNRRLYDTGRSRYITLEELAELIRSSAADEIRVVSAKDGEDLTTATLAQIIVEGRGAARLLPVPMLVEMVRMGDTALAEFLGSYVTWAFQVYVEARKGVRALAPFAPFLAGTPLGRLLGLGPGHGPPEPQAAGGGHRAPTDRGGSGH